MVNHVYLVTWRSGDWMLVDIDTKHVVAQGKDAIADKPLRIAKEQSLVVEEYYSCIPSFEIARFAEYLQHEYGGKSGAS